MVCYKSLLASMAVVLTTISVLTHFAGFELFALAMIGMAAVATAGVPAVFLGAVRPLMLLAVDVESADAWKGLRSERFIGIIFGAFLAAVVAGAIDLLKGALL